jgi:hypothetical protein
MQGYHTIISEKDNRSKDCNRMEKIKIKRKHNKSKWLKIKNKMASSFL